MIKKKKKDVTKKENLITKGPGLPGKRQKFRKDSISSGSRSSTGRRVPGGTSKGGEKATGPLYNLRLGKKEVSVGVHLAAQPSGLKLLRVKKRRGETRKNMGERIKRVLYLSLRS